MDDKYCNHFFRNELVYVHTIVIISGFAEAFAFLIMYVQVPDR
jgi:hypothetical protein